MAVPSRTLPEALTAQILQHVPQQHRLKQCALVCKAWAASAALVTVDVERRLEGMPFHALAAFERWLMQHAGQLENLQLSFGAHSERQMLQLPLNKLGKLQRLELDGFMLRLPGDRGSSWNQCYWDWDRNTDDSEGTSSSRQEGEEKEGEEREETQTDAGVLLPCLQQLQLSRVRLASTSSLQQLANAPALTSLKADKVDFVQSSWAGHCMDGSSRAAAQQMAAAVAVADLLQQLPRLAVLELPDLPICNTAVQNMGAMQGLHEVSLARVHPLPPCNLQHLPSSITQLCFHGNRHGPSGYGTTPSLPPRLQQLSGLLRLQLGECAVPSTLLGSFTRLQVLQLEDCLLLPDGDGDHSGGTAALLDALAGMTCLQDLHLSAVRLDSIGTAPQRFAAMTASTQLTRLVLRSRHDTPLPLGAAQYMFPAGRPLPLLQHLVISPLLNDWDNFDEDAGCIDSADIGCIASCCQGLQWLEIPLCVLPFTDLTVLLQLPPSCRSLTVGGDAIRQAAMPVLAQLTQLTYLCVRNTPGFKDAELEPLANLELEHLYVHNSGLSDVVSEGGNLDVRSSFRKGSVSEQLEALCDRSPVCAPMRLRRQREANQRLQQELSRSQAEVRRLQQQLKAARGAAGCRKG